MPRRCRRRAAGSCAGVHAAACAPQWSPAPESHRPTRPRLCAVQRSGQALRPDRAVRAQRLGPLQVGGAFREPQVRVRDVARQRESSGLHFNGHHVSVHLLPLRFLVKLLVSYRCLIDRDPEPRLRFGAQTNVATDPGGVGSVAWEAVVGIPRCIPYSRTRHSRLRRRRGA